MIMLIKFLKLPEGGDIIVHIYLLPIPWKTYISASWTSVCLYDLLLTSETCHFPAEVWSQHTICRMLFSPLQQPPHNVLGRGCFLILGPKVKPKWAKEYANSQRIYIVSKK